ncbi:chromosome segregation protein [Dorea longicatena]|uniref:Nuclease SbcCD subunit C n=1 Tax=Dorea longicatena TaxID=88431 RepID=A0A173SB93_9FIRM|nr:AAA family ATPase [Dorea longicatena]CUM87510.1 chromosome segregation protein [Dorea longicatena]
MKQIKLLSMHIQNFKGCKDRTIEFGEKTRISGANATGKTTIFDAFTWLLFGKDSLGSSDFDIRPLDADGKMADRIEISVESKISVDGNEYELKKVQKQKWVEKRGAGTTGLQGNINEFEINGYPKRQKEFKDFIAGIIDEDIFTLITNPTAFNSLPWKKQRETLMKFIGTFSDVEIAETFGERYTKLIPELRIASTDDILKKYAKVKNTLNKDMVEIPARIDEISKQLVIADVGALEIEKSAKEVALQKVEDELSGGNSQLEDINSKRQDIMNLKFRISEIQNEENQKLFDKSKALRDDLVAKEDTLRSIKREIADTNSEIHSVHSKYEWSVKEVKRLQEEWKAEKAKTFPEMVPMEPIPNSASVCPTCGQDLPEDVIQKNIENYEKKKQAYEDKYMNDFIQFKERKSKKISEIEIAGTEAATDRDKYKSREEELRKSMAELDSKLAEAQKAYDSVQEELDRYPKTADISENTDYKATVEKISVLEKEIETMSSDTSGRTELEAKKAVLKDEIAEIAGKILAADNSKVKERIAELEAEQKEVGQKIAEQEQMIDLVEDFIREKMNRISAKVNEMFKIVSFKLFSEQINGGLKETCECTVNGVPLSSLNNGHRIIAGLDIIQSLSNLYEVSCPVFIDNSEAVNEVNFPEMNAQTIHLAVTDDKVLKVESEDK